MMPTLVLKSVCVLFPGEDVYISLYGVCEELNIQLQPDFVPLQKTFISLSTVHTVSFTNRYDVPLKYFWTIWPSLQEEAVSLLRYIYTNLIRYIDMQDGGVSISTKWCLWYKCI